MNVSGETWLCFVGWAFTLTRLQSVHWKSVWDDGGTALNIWLMMFFFTVTLTSLGDVGSLLDIHTINNLSKLLAYPSILITIYLATRESLNAIKTSSSRQIVRWLSTSLAVVNIALLVIYALFLWRAPEFTSVPRSLAEAMFRFVAFYFGGVMCVVEVRAYLAYFPMEKSSILRLRASMVILCAVSSFSFFLVRIAQVAGYFWPILGSPALNALSVMLLVLSSLLYFAVFLNNRAYMRFLMIANSPQRWRTLQDLRYLRVRLLRLCPEVASPVTDPSLWRFLFNPEYYLYSAIIAIMDSKTLLDDLLSEGALYEEPALWEGDMLREVVQVKKILQSIIPSGNFWETVDTYRRAGKELSRISSC